MAWRYEKEENGGYAIVIDGWENGIADSPFEGHQDMRSVNLDTVPGSVSVGFGLTQSTVSGATLGIPISKATQFSSGAAIGYYILDADGQVFKATSISGTWTYLSSGVSLTGASNTDCIWAWKGYVFKTRGTNVDYWNGTTWSNGWQSITGATPHIAVVGQDDVCYITNGSAIISLLEKTVGGFDPTSAATYTYNTTALQLPTYEIAQSLCELGTNLLVGGSQNAIYPWNRISTSYSYPIFCAEPFIKKLVTANNNAFVFTGNVTGRGRIYITNGSQIEVWKKFPDSVSGYIEPYFKIYDAIYHRNKIIFGAEVVKNSDGSVITSPTAQVWAIDCTTKALRGLSDTLGGAASPRVIIQDQSNNSIPGFGYVIGQSDGSTHKIAYSGTAAGTGTATVTTDQIPVGTFLDKRTFQQIEVKFASVLASGESVSVNYASDFSGGNVGTISQTTTTVGNYLPINFEKSQWLQIQLVMTGNSSNSGCAVKEIRIR